jgi:hypothetical protein
LIEIGFDRLDIGASEEGFEFRMFMNVKELTLEFQWCVGRDHSVFLVEKG